MYTLFSVMQASLVERVVSLIVNSGDRVWSNTFTISDLRDDGKRYATSTE